MRRHHEGDCVYCGLAVGTRWCMEHMVPVRRGGSNDAENLVLACIRCNRIKGKWTPSEWRFYVGRPFRVDISPGVIERWPIETLPAVAPPSLADLRRVNRRRLLAGLCELPIYNIPAQVVTALHIHGGSEWEATYYYPGEKRWPALEFAERIAMTHQGPQGFHIVGISPTTIPWFEEVYIPLENFAIQPSLAK